MLHTLNLCDNKIVATSIILPRIPPFTKHYLPNLETGPGQFVKGWGASSRYLKGRPAPGHSHVLHAFALIPP